MPFIMQSEKDKEDLEAAKNGGDQPFVKTDSSAGGSLESGTAAQAQAPKTTGFVGIQKYLQQNEPQSKMLAEKIGTGVQEDINKASTDIAESGAKFESKVKENEQVFNPNLMAKVNAPETLSAQEKQQIINQRDASYTGAKSLEDTEIFQPMQEKVNVAKQKASYVSSDEGRKTLLKNIQDKRASQGVTNLNNLLVGGSKSAQGVMDQFSQGASDLDVRLKNASDAAQARAKQAADTTKKTSQDVKSGLNTAYQGFQTQMDAKTIAAQQAAQQRADAIKQNLSTGKIDSSYLADLGLSQAQADLLSQKGDLIGGDLSRFGSFTPAENVISRNQAATAEDFARQQALLDLAGRQDQYIDESLSGDTSDLTDFNYEEAKNIAFNKESNSRNAEFDALYNNILINPMLMNQLGIFSPQAARNYVDGLKSQYVNGLKSQYNV